MRLVGHLTPAAAARFATRWGWRRTSSKEFYQDTFIDAQGNQLGRSWLFSEARNNLGKHSPDENRAQRTIRGSMNDRDRVLCWLEILRRDTLFQDMAEKYGRSPGTYHNEFKDMTTAAQNMPCLVRVSFRVVFEKRKQVLRCVSL